MLFTYAAGGGAHGVLLWLPRRALCAAHCSNMSGVLRLKSPDILEQQAAARRPGGPLLGMSAFMTGGSAALWPRWWADFDALGARGLRRQGRHPVEVAPQVLTAGIQPPEVIAELRVGRVEIVHGRIASSHEASLQAAPR